MVDQANKIATTSRSYINTATGEAAKKLCDLTGYEKYLPCSTGGEACEAAVKVARRWGYAVKGIPDNQANILMMKKCFWGRGLTATGWNSDPNRSK